MPRLFASKLYLATKQGYSCEEIASILGLPLEWVEERIEAARLCFDFQVAPSELNPAESPFDTLFQRR